jgi:putative DNA-invertase from lambdoid prophage Rac
MAIVAYGRASTRDHTVENDRVEIERAGYEVDYWFADKGVFGKVPANNRPQFAALVSEICRGDILIVTKLDRLGCDAGNVARTIRGLAAGKIEVLVLQFGKLDLASPAGKLVLTTLTAVAEIERDFLIERTNAGVARAKEEGKKLGRRPKTTPAQRAVMVEGFAKGIPIKDLARLYSINRATVLKIVKPKVTK